MISSAINYLLYHCNNDLITVAIIVINILLVCLIFMIKNIELTIQHKIHNFRYNTIFITIYIMGPFLLLITSRLYAIGNSLNLKILLIECKKNNPLVTILIILIFILTFLIIIKIQEFLRKELRKRFIYTNYHTLYDNITNRNKKRFFDRIIFKLTFCYTYKNILMKVQSDISCIFSIFNYDLKLNLLRNKKAKNFFRIMPYFLLILLIIYDCFYNNWVLTKMYYYLPVLFLYNLWYNTTLFLINTNDSLNRIIYERYYEEENVLYVGTEDAEDNFLNDYLKNKLQCPSTNYYFNSEENKYIDVIETITEWSHMLMLNRRYIRSTTSGHSDEYIFINPNTGDGVIFTEEQFLEIVNSKED